MDKITAVELRKNLEGTCIRVKGGDTLLLTDHGNPSLLLVPIRVAQVIEKIGKCDEMMEIEGRNEIIIGVMRYFALRLEKGESIVFMDVIDGIVESCEKILLGKKTTKEVGLDQAMTL